MAAKVPGAENQPMNPVTKMIGPGTTRADQTLYDRIGGEDKLDKIVTGVYNSMRNDKEIGKQFARFRLEKLKERTVDYLRGEWGGDAYIGSDLWISHSHMGINNHWYDIMMKYYVQELKRAKIGKGETKECLDSLEKMRKPIVDRDLKFKDMYLKHTANLAARAGGDGWGKVATTQKEREEKEKETLKLIAQNGSATAMNNKNTFSFTGGDASTAASSPPASTTTTPRAKKAAAKTTASPRKVVKKAAPSAQERKAEIPKVDFKRFIFDPSMDAPPPEMPSSMPSGAELLFRLSAPALGQGPRTSPVMTPVH